MQSKKVWAGRVLSGITVVFLLIDSAMKLVKARVAVEGTIELGYPESSVIVIGMVLLVCTALYAVPRTSALGAVLLTGYLGGAVATHLRVGNPLFSHILSPVYFGAILWAGLYLRDQRLRDFISKNS